MIKSSRETKEIVSTKEIEKTERTCDICRKEIDIYSHSCKSEFGSYENRNFESDEFEFEKGNVIIGKITNSYNYGDSWGSNAEIFDICADCYENKIKALLKETYGIIPRELEYDR